MSETSKSGSAGGAGDPVQGGIFTGAAWGLLAALIAAGWLVFTRMGHAGILNGYDLVALRYGVAALILLPYAVRHRSLLVGHGWGALTLLILGGGFPYGLAAVWGLSFAPVAHGGALMAGTIPTFTAMFGVAILAQRLQSRQVLGLVPITVSTRPNTCRAGKYWVLCSPLSAQGQLPVSVFSANSVHRR